MRKPRKNNAKIALVKRRQSSIYREEKVPISSLRSVKSNQPLEAGDLVHVRVSHPNPEAGFSYELERTFLEKLLGKPKSTIIYPKRGDFIGFYEQDGTIVVHGFQARDEKGGFFTVVKASSRLMRIRVLTPEEYAKIDAEKLRKERKKGRENFYRRLVMGRIQRVEFVE